MLHLPASLADRAAVSLGEAVTGIDDRNVRLLVTAIRRQTTPLPTLAISRNRAAIRDGQIREVTSTPGPPPFELAKLPSRRASRRLFRSTSSSRRFCWLRSCRRCVSIWVIVIAAPMITMPNPAQVRYVCRRSGAAGCVPREASRTAGH